MLGGRVWERALLLTRFFSHKILLKIGEELGLHIEEGAYDIDRWRIAVEVAKVCTDEQLKDFWKHHHVHSIGIFRGKWFTVTRDGILLTEGSLNAVRSDVTRALKQGGLKAYAFLKALVTLGGTAKFNDIAREMESYLNEEVWPTYTLNILRKYGLVLDTGSQSYPTKAIPAEILPTVKEELENFQSRFEMMKKRQEKKKGLSTQLAREEVKHVERMDTKLHRYLQDIDVDAVQSFGRDLSIETLAETFEGFFGQTSLDPLLSMIQQYSIADATILSPAFKETRLKTGFNLAFFGDPGTGKTFSSVDIITGSNIVPPFGIPGRNRYCSGMTPAAFLRIAEAYEGKRFNFLVPEFREWFTHSTSMAEYLKLALERKPIKYETARETVNSYEFSSFFNVNYNVTVGNQSWASLSRDPHFRALRDRLLCKLHRMTMDRYKAISDSQIKLLMEGRETMDQFSKNIRDHLTLIFALENGLFPARRLPRKEIKLTAKVLNQLKRARDEMLAEVEQPPFSPRLEKRVIQLACSATLLEYFQTDDDILEVSDAAYSFAENVFKEEIQTRILERT